MDQLPCDIILSMFLGLHLKYKDAVAFGLVTKGHYATFLTARASSFNFHLKSYIYKNQVYKLLVVETYAFRFSSLCGTAEMETYNGDGCSIITPFEWHEFNHYDDKGDKPYIHYGPDEPRYLIPGAETSSSFTPLIKEIARKVRPLYIVKELLEKTQASFPGHNFVYSHTNVVLHFDYSEFASDHRPFYKIMFDFDFIYESKAYNGIEMKESHYEGNAVRGWFREPYHRTDTIFKFLQTVSSMETYKEWEDFVIYSTYHNECHDTSIVPVRTRVVQPGKVEHVQK